MFGPKRPTKRKTRLTEATGCTVDESPGAIDFFVERDSKLIDEDVTLGEASCAGGGAMIDTSTFISCFLYVPS